MKTYPTIVFTDSDEAVEIYGYSISKKLVSIRCNDPQENLSGFSIYEGENKIFDGSDFTYRWDVVDQRQNEIFYTNDPDYRQTEPFQDLSHVQEQAEPLSNKELTEAVADLMCEISMMQLGL